MGDTSPFKGLLWNDAIFLRREALRGPLSGDFAQNTIATTPSLLVEDTVHESSRKKDRRAARSSTPNRLTDHGLG